MQSPDSRETYLAALRHVLDEGIVRLEVTGAFEGLTPHLTWEERADVYRAAQQHFRYLALPSAFINGRVQVLCLWPDGAGGVKGNLPADTYVPPPRNGSPGGFPMAREAVRHARNQWGRELRPMPTSQIAVAFVLLDEDRAEFMRHAAYGLVSRRAIVVLSRSGGRGSHLTHEPAEIREIIRPPSYGAGMEDVPMAYYGHRTGALIPSGQFETHPMGFVPVQDAPDMPVRVREAFMGMGYLRG